MTGASGGRNTFERKSSNLVKDDDKFTPGSLASPMAPLKVTNLQELRIKMSHGFCEIAVQNLIIRKTRRQFYFSTSGWQFSKCDNFSKPFLFP